MYLVKSALSAVFDKLSLKYGDSEIPSRSSGLLGLWEETRINYEGHSTSSLRFHSVHGKAITLTSDSSIASRDERYFEHSVVFSHRPVCVNETVAVEVMEVSADFHGPLRIGFTSFNPEIFEDYVVPLGRDLKNTQGFWIKSVQMFTMKVGRVIYFKVDSRGVVLYGVDGKNGGIFLKDVDVSQQLWVIVEAYGKVQAIRFVDKTMVLENPNFNVSELNENLPPHCYPYRNRRTMQTNGRVVLHPMNTQLSARRSAFVAPLANVTSIDTQLSLESPTTPYASPIYSPGVCIICTDREKNAAFNECGHLCMCLECAEDFSLQGSPSGRERSPEEMNLCPICRKPISSILRVYI